MSGYLHDFAGLVTRIYFMSFRNSYYRGLGGCTELLICSIVIVGTEFIKGDFLLPGKVAIRLPDLLKCVIQGKGGDLKESL
jgi:hypothetical protein